MKRVKMYNQVEMFGYSPCSGCSRFGGVKAKPRQSKGRPTIAFVGPAPDHRGGVVLGEGGKMLREVLSSLGFDLSSIYYTCAVLCAGKETVGAKELEKCKGRLLNELTALDPELVIPLGEEATDTLIGGGSISKRRGFFKEAYGFSILPMQDPDKIINAPDNFLDFLNDLREAKRILKGGAPLIDPPYENYVMVTTDEGYYKLIDRLETVEKMSVDLETDSLDFINGNILSIGFSWSRGTGVSVDWHGLISGRPERIEELNTELRRIECVYHHSQFDNLWLLHRGMSPNFVQDTMLDSYALDERQGSHGLKRLANTHYHCGEYDKSIKEVIKISRAKQRRDPPTEKESPWDLQDWEDPIVRKAIMLYNAADCDFTFRLSEDLKEDMRIDEVEEVSEKLLVPAARHFTQLKRNGILVDVEYHNQLGAMWKKEIEDLEIQLRSFEGAETLDFSSPKQIAHYLYDVLKLRQMRGKEGQTIRKDDLLEEIMAIEDAEAQEFFHTSTSHIFSNMTPRSTNSFMLYFLGDQHEWPLLLVKHRLVIKKYNTYYVGYQKSMSSDNRIRPDTRVHGTKTGRLSSTNPNIHGMVRSDMMKKIFISDPGYSLIAADYSAAEVRVLAHFAQDETLIKALAQSDIHREISKELFGITEAQLKAMDPEEQKLKRRSAKMITFGLAYGRSAQSLAPQLNVSLEEAEAFMERFFRIMPGVRNWISRQKEIVAKHMEVKSLFGRKRRFQIIVDKKHLSRIERQAVNMPIQSTASDITLLAHIKVMSILREEGIKALTGFHIHDALMLQVEDRNVSRAVQIIRECMEIVPFDTKVPFIADIEVGKSWGELKKVKRN